MEKKIKVIVVDDEQEAREGLKHLIEQDDEVTLVAVCKNGIQAIEALTNFKIDLMFLDIQMPQVDGFEVVRSVPEARLPSIIFTTAYDEYAVKAFEIHAIDFLLKPFTDERFYEALNRAKGIIKQKNNEDFIRKLRNIALNAGSKGGHENILISPEADDHNSKLIVKENGKVYFIDLSDVVWIEAFDYYVKIHVKDRFYMLRESMKKMAEQLPKNTFARIHKSSIINLKFIDTVEILGNGEYQVLLNSGEELKVSRNYKDSIKNLLDQ